MKRLLARGARLAAVLLPLAVVVAALSGGAASAGPAPDLAAADPGHGRTIFLGSCSSCHGQSGQGTQRGPSLIGVGTATVDFYLQTGRMPLAQEQKQATSGPPKFSQSEIADLDAYVGSLGSGGPGIPSLQPGDVTQGRELFLQNCAACHSSSGTGYTQVGGLKAPSLLDTDPQQVAEAVRVGPALMPHFSDHELTADQLDSIVSYVQQLRRLNQQGGASLGLLGPVTETLIGFAGVALLLIVVRLLGKRAGQ